MNDRSSNVPLIRARDLRKTFGAIQALSGVSLDIMPGEVHGLVGANGAGKSTFLNILCGVVHADAGEVAIDGLRTTIASPRQAADLGFSFIRQELALIPELPAWVNMTMGDRPQTFLGIGDNARRRAMSQEVAERLALSFSLERPVGELTVAERGLVAIGRALVGRARFVSMDEPTASLSDAECMRLFDVVRELSASGVAVAYVSHRLDEIQDLCDTITVFKDGAVVRRHARGEYTHNDLVLGITGASTVAQAVERPPAELRPEREPLLQVSALQRAPRVENVSLALHRHEILGLAGVVGAGRTETMRLIFGAERATAGEMTLDGKPFAPRSISDAIANGIALVPEERRSQALLMDESIAFNISMGDWRSSRVARWLPVVSTRRAAARARRYVDGLAIKASSVDAPVRTLSGGNQQKVVFGRWLARNARVLLLDEPTRGVDIGARHNIWQTVEQFALDGGAVLVSSSELDELAVCHRVIVIVEGRIVGEIEGPGVTEQQILETIYSAQEGTST